VNVQFRLVDSPQVIGFFRLRQKGVYEFRRDFVNNIFNDEIYRHEFLPLLASVSGVARQTPRLFLRGISPSFTRSFQAGRTKVFFWSENCVL
jgi:hypothetical protein